MTLRCRKDDLRIQNIAGNAVDALLKIKGVGGFVDMIAKRRITQNPKYVELIRQHGTFEKRYQEEFEAAMRGGKRFSAAAPRPHLLTDERKDNKTYKRMTYRTRLRIEALYNFSRFNAVRIAEELGYSHQAIYAEMKRGFL